MEINGHEIAKQLYEDLKKRVTILKKKHITPHLVVFLIGEDPASVAYVTLKMKRGEEIGAKVTIMKFNTSVTTDVLAKKITLLNADPFVHAILIQRPLPPQIDIAKLELLTDPQKDIDGFHPDSPYTLPLPLAVERILEEVYILSLRGASCHCDPPECETFGGEAISNNIKTENSYQLERSPRLQHKCVALRARRIREDDKNTVEERVQQEGNFWQNPERKKWLHSQDIVLIGKGPTGGGPILSYFNKLHITPTVIDSKTKNQKELMKKADIIISAVGKENVVKAEDIKKGVILISVGIVRGANNRLTGDYNEDDIKSIAKYYTPTPRGVGPVNVAKLMENLVTATEKQTTT